MARKPSRKPAPAKAGETRGRATRNRALRAGAPYPKEVAPPALRPGQAPAGGAAFAEDPDPTDRGLPPAGATKVTVTAGRSRVETTTEAIQAAADGLRSNRLGGDAGERLRGFVERIESLEADKAELVGDIREVFAEAKADGFDTRAMREVIRERRLDKPERDEREALRDLYRHALGMLDGTPLGDAALARAAE